MATRSTRPRRLARKRINPFLQHHGVDKSARRLAYTMDRDCAVLAVSGKPGVNLAIDLYGVAFGDLVLLERINAMAERHGCSLVDERTADAGTEAHLSMTLVLNGCVQSC